MTVAGTDAPSVPAPAQPVARQPLVAGYARRLYWLWPALLTLVLAGYRLGRPSLWADELASWGAVRLSWPDLFRLVRHVDAVIAPYYLILKAWTALAGTSPVALRLPSVLAMTVAAAMVSVLGAHLRGRWVGLLGGLAFAAVPTTSRYAQEARPYAFTILFAVLATLLLLRLLDRPGPGTGLAYALAVALLGASHLLALLLLAAHAVAARRRVATWAAWAGVGLLPLLPLVWLGFRQRGQVGWIPPPTVETVLGIPEIVFVSSAAGGVLIGLGLLAFSRRGSALLLAAWGLLPPAGLALAGLVAPLFYARYLLYVVPAWVLLAAVTLGRVARTRALAALVVLGLLGAPAQSEMRTRDGHPTASAAAGQIIAGNERPGDAIAYELHDTAPWEARDVVARYVPAARRPLDVFQVTPQRTGGHLAATECADLAACLDRADPPRLWILRKSTWVDPLDGIGAPKEDLLRARYRLVRLWFVRGLTVALYAAN
jgi:mannosyltransferase